MMRINATELVGVGFPPDEGKKLAKHLLAKPDVEWADLEIDVRELAASLLISAFFNGFLQTVAEERPALLTTARQVRWDLKFDFQKSNVAKWMAGFTPQASA